MSTHSCFLESSLRRALNPSYISHEVYTSSKDPGNIRKLIVEIYEPISVTEAVGKVQEICCGRSFEMRVQKCGNILKIIFAKDPISRWFLDNVILKIPKKIRKWEETRKQCKQ